MSNPTTDSASMNRRNFLKGSLLTAGALTAAGGAASTRAQTAARTSGIIGSNERIRIGLIGCGALGRDYHIPKLMEMSRDSAMNMELVAVCDIYEPRKQHAAKITGAELFHDYRRMLDRPDIHGVVIVTPDHWHAKMAIDAMEAGKDIHLEKPMTLYWEEAKAVYHTAVRTRRVVQVGAEGTSMDMFWQARKLIEAGRIGKLVWVSGGVYRNVPGGDWNYPIEEGCSPKNLDWDAFLGPAPKRPFDPERFFRYRKYWDYSGGLATDLTAHVLSALQVAVGPEFPTRVMAAGGIYCHKDRETPDTFHMMVEYPSNYVATLFCTQTTESGHELTIRGERGTLRFDRRGGDDRAKAVTLTPEPAFAGKEAKAETVPSEPRMDHDRNFIHCMRTREKPHCDVLTGYKVTVALALAVKSWREGKMFKFDPEKEELVA